MSLLLRLQGYTKGAESQGNPLNSRCMPALEQGIRKKETERMMLIQQNLFLKISDAMQRAMFL